MNNNLQKVIKLVKKTGDRLVVYDPSNSDNIFVVMSIEEYEKLVIGKSEVRNLTEDELLDKINRDIAIWKSEQSNKEFEEKTYFEEPDFLSNNREEYNFSYRKKGIDSFIGPEDRVEEKIKSHWKIPYDRKEGAEEVVIEEDRQYLENIDY